MLDSRLSLARDLFVPCSVGADIGTDHALLPCALLQAKRCQRMLLCDVSPKALLHAEETVRRHQLGGRVRLVCADGLNALDEPCGCVSILGMGGRTLSDILHRGADRLRGAALVLSAHTEQALVRQAIVDIGYHLTDERLCLAAGRFYVVWRAQPGSQSPTPEAIRYGDLLFQEPAPLLNAYLEHRLTVLRAKRCGLASGSTPANTTEVDAAIAFYEQERRKHS